MKKTAIFLTVALILTALLPCLTAGVLAAEPVVTVDGQSAYEYADDAAAISDGAIAKFTRTSDSKVLYVKSLAAAFRFGGDATYGADTVDVIVGTVTLSAGIAANVGARSMTINGNGCTISDSGLTDSVTALQITGSTADAVVTLKNFNFRLPTTAKVTTLMVGTNGSSTPVTVVLDNVDILAKTVSHEVVPVWGNCKLILESGTAIKTEQNNPWNTNGGSIAVILCSNGAVEVREGASITAKGPAIYSFTNSTGATVTVNGGTIRSTNVSAITTGSGATHNIVINGGTVTSANSNQPAINAVAGTTTTITGGTISNINNKSAFVNSGNATISGGTFTTVSGEGVTNSAGAMTVNGGTFTGSAAMNITGGTVTVNGGTFIAKTITALCATSGGTAILNGGVFTTESDDVTLLYGFGVINSGNGTARTGGIIYVNGGTYHYTGCILHSNASSDGTGKIYVSGGSFTGSKIVFNGNGSNSEGRIILSDLPKTSKGAAVRTVADESGIRFTSTISKAVLNTAESLKKAGTAVTYGTLIAPAEYVSTAGIFTKEALLAADLSAAADKRFVDIPAVDGIVTDEDGNVTVHAALVDLLESNYNRNFAAIAYVSYQTDNGTVTLYGDFSATDNVRSIREVAYNALADVKTAREEGYNTLVSEWYAFSGGVWVKQTGMAYSCYSNAQLAVIRSYIPAE